MVPYLSVDIETTGLNPATDQILEVAMVLEDWSGRPVEQLPTFHVLLNWDRIQGDPAALAMHGDLFKEILAKGDNVIDPDELSCYMHDWLRFHNLIGKQTATGKNFGTFDLNFLKVHNPIIASCFHHRVLDAASLFWKPGEAIKSTQELMLICGLSDGKHRAVEDARNVVRMIRYLYTDWPTDAPPPNEQLINVRFNPKDERLDSNPVSSILQDDVMPYYDVPVEYPGAEDLMVARTAITHAQGIKFERMDPNFYESLQSALYTLDAYAAGKRESELEDIPF